MTGTPLATASAVAPVNIAVVKYWGKRDVDLNLPTNDSISATLSDLDTTTEVKAFAGVKEHKLWVNEKAFPITKRIAKVIAAFTTGLPENGWWGKGEYWLEIRSHNTVPTASGLASSASGLAALTLALNKLYQKGLGPEELSVIARQGSGSASRSLHGGWVRWEAGTRADGTDSKATQVIKSQHWDELSVLVLLVSHKRKKVGSTEGMQRSVKTIPANEFAARVETASLRCTQIAEALRDRDFSRFARITMKDSNAFHALCLNTFPPIRYLEDVSYRIIELVHSLNQAHEKPVAAYTFDAGPNAVIFTPTKYVPLLLAALLHVFPPKDKSPDEWLKVFDKRPREGLWSGVGSTPFGAVYGHGIEEIFLTGLA